VTDTARVLLTFAILSGVAVSVFARRITQMDPMQPERLIGELRLAQWAAILLAAAGAIPIGLSVAHQTVPFGHLDAAIGVAFIGLAGIVLQRDPREALLMVAGGFILHALVDLAHRPGVLSPDLAPRWFTAGCATYDVYLAAVCYWARRR
jgi:hypothetical protein